MRLLSSDEIKSLEQQCFKAGLSAQLLMENAGRAVASVVLEKFEELNKVVIFCAAGNNSGDGFVLARVLDGLGVNVKIILNADISKFSAETKINYQLLRADLFVEFSEDLKDADLIIDALLGTGSVGAARGNILSAINQLNRLSSTYQIPVVSLDLPSGVDPDTSSIGTSAVKADLTISFHEPKWGNILDPGNINNGELIIADIGIQKKNIGANLLEPYSFKGLGLSRSIHKGNKGHVVIIGGAQGKSGSIKLSGIAALKASAGLVTLIVPYELANVVSFELLELMSDNLPGDGNGNFIAPAKERIVEILAKKDALIIGPGMGTGKGASELLEQVLNNVNVPTVLDADALTNLADMNLVLSDNFVITPHPGEASKLLDLGVEQIQKDRISAVRQLSAKYSCWSVLKGAQTLISSPRGELSLCSYSCPALATAGSGDVLAGIIASLLAAGFSMEYACQLAVFSHAAAGLILEDGQLGYLGATASDIIDTVPLVMNSLPSKEPKSLFKYTGENEFFDVFLAGYEY